MTGTTLSHYRIEEELGRGGMGIVYKAEDTKLDRTVALKILPASALTSEDDRARFYREAKSAAALNHSNIAQIYQIDEAVPEGAPSDDLRPFIAMEFIDGFTLDSALNDGPMSLEEAVRIATQVASALEAAHDKNIVHRDIKAANVMLTAKGEAKVLDFGLAKTAHSTMLTRMGSTLGTVAYMSPEQARGEEVDGRTDLWALGIVLYQLIAGRLPFGGDYEQAVTYSILNEDPQPLTAIRTGVPMGLEWIVSKLLAKKADDRYQSAKDLIVDLRTVDLTHIGLSRTSSVKSMPAATPAAVNGSSRLSIQRVVWMSLLVLAACAGWWVGTQGGSQQTAGTMKRISQPVPLGGVVGAVDISNNGRLVAFGTDTIEILDLSTGSIRTYDAPEVFVHLAFSPDDRFLLLTTSTGLKILSVESGSLIDVAETIEGGPRAEWIDSENILFEDLASIWTRSLTSGESREVIRKDTLGGQFDADFPSMLPDGKTVMAAGESRDEDDWLGFWDFRSGELKKRINLPAHRPQWLDPGHLVFVMDGDLVAMPFDLGTLSQTGPLIPLEDHVRAEGLAVSKEGTLVHVGTHIGIVADTRPVFPIVSRMSGASIDIETPVDMFPSAIYRSAAVHPSGLQAAVVVEGLLQPDDYKPPTDVWILDFETGNRRAVTTGGVSDYPAWNPRGDSLYFVRDHGGSSSIMIKAASGRGSESTIVDTAIPASFDLDVSSDGKWALWAGGIPTSRDQSSAYALFDLDSGMSTMEADWGGAKEGPNGNPRHFAFSPDNKYFAYEDQGAIFVQSVEDPDSPPTQVWENGMTTPQWAPDGSELYVRSTLSGGFGTPVQLDPFFTTVGDPVDYTSMWYVVAGQLFDMFPEKGRMLGAIQDSEFEETDDGETTIQSFNLNLMVNITSELRSRE